MSRLRISPFSRRDVPMLSKKHFCAFTIFSFVTSLSFLYWWGCAYLLEYVCSRGPLSPLFLTALLCCLFPFRCVPNLECCITLPPPCCGLPAWRAQTDPHNRCGCTRSRPQQNSGLRCCNRPAICGYDSLIRHSSSSPVNPPALLACMPSTHCGCRWGELSKRLLC